MSLAARGAPPVHGYLVDTLLENVSGAPVTGIAPGGFGAEAPFMVKCRSGHAVPAMRCRHRQPGDHLPA
jgi:hypothetical protein